MTPSMLRGVGVGLLALTGVAGGCSSSAATATSSAGGNSGAGGQVDAGGAGGSLATPVVCGATSSCLVPPPPTPGAPVGDGAGATVLVVDVFRIGDVGLDGVASETAWQSYGFDLDGLAFPTAKTSGHCIPQDGVKLSDVVIDGPGGVDNAFGKLVLPSLEAIAETWVKGLQAAIDAGEGSHAIRIVGLGVGADQSLPAPGSGLYPVTGASDGAGGVTKPGGDWTAYAWRRRPESSPTTFAAGYVAGNVWVSGPPQDITLLLGPRDAVLPLTLHHAVISLPLAPDRLRGVHGTIAGVLDSDELSLAVKTHGAIVSKCTLDGVVPAIERAADMLPDGTQDGTRRCKGISIGLGFDARASTLSDEVAATVLQKAPCTP